MGSIMAQRVIFSPHTFVGAELTVLTALAWHSDNAGCVSTVSARALALLSRLSEKQTNRVLKKLACSGAIQVKSGGGRGHHTVYRLNLEMFNQSKRSVIHKGGVVGVFTDAALDAKAEAAYKKRIQDAQGDVLSPVLPPKIRITEWAYRPIPKSLTRGRPTLRNTLQRRASRARRADLNRLVEANIKLFEQRFPLRLP